MRMSELTFLETSVQDVFFGLWAFRNSLSSSLIMDLFRIRNLFQCIEMKSKQIGPEMPAPYISHPKGMKIQVKNLSFRYHPEFGMPVLKDVNFVIEPGEIVSVVGYNGSGIDTSAKVRR